MSRHSLAPLLACAVILAIAACTVRSEKDLVAAAEAYLEKRDTKSAVIELKSALQLQPDSPEARLLLGRVFLESGDPVSALVELGKAQALKVADEIVVPVMARAMLAMGDDKKLLAQYGSLRFGDGTANADLLTSLAEASMRVGDNDNARKLVSAAMLAKPEYVPATVLQARQKAIAGAPDAALSLLEQALVKDPGSEAAGILKGDVLWHGKRDLDAALTTFRTVLAQHPNSVPAHASIISLHAIGGQAAAAKEQLVAMEKVLPAHPETMYHKAQFALVEKEYKAARELTELLLKVFPDDARTLELAGAIEFRSQQHAQAEGLLGRALKVDPKRLLSRHMLAQTYLQTDQPEKVVDLLRPVLEGAGPDATTLALAGDAFTRLGDIKSADAAFLRAAKAAPGDSRVRTALAWSQLTRGNANVAIAELESMAQADAAPRADLALFSARVQQNDLAGALKALDALQRKLPTRALPHQLRGRVQLLQKDRTAAIRSFDAALAHEPNYFPAVASLAALDLAAGKADAAQARFKAVLKSKPGDAQALLALAEIGARTGAPRDEVARQLREAVMSNPADPRSQRILIDHLLASADGAAAVVAAQSATIALPNDLEMLTLLGRTQLASGDLQQGLSTFKKLAALRPNSALDQVNLAEAHAANKDAGNTSRALKRALELKPGLQAAQSGLIRLAVLEKRPQDGLNLARTMQREKPDEALGFMLAGDVEISREAWDAAASAYRAALQRARSSETAIKLHHVLTSGGKQIEADRLSVDWQKAHPKDAMFRFYLGDLAMKQSNHARAESHYRAVLELQPANALALNNVAWLLVKQGKPGALPIAERANALLPDRAPLLDTLALALAIENQLPKAIEMQKRAMQRSPGDPGLQLGLAKLFLKADQKPMARAELEALARLGSTFSAQAEVAALLSSAF